MALLVGCSPRPYPADAPSWSDWRGPLRAAHSPDVPERLPAQLRLLWKRPLSGPAMSGLSVVAGRVVVADKTADGNQDVFRCLEADSGRQVWELAYPAAGNMDGGNSPRATPVIHEGLVYVLGAFGDLHCLKLDSGRLVWKRNLARDFGGEAPDWGFCSTPLVADDKLIVNPGGAKASLVALDRRTGRVAWAVPGEAAAYASFILGEFGGRRQIVGYDKTSAGGWDVATGRRLWRLVPEQEGEFNVPTPAAVDGKLLLSTEKNGSRLYGFDAQGCIIARPLAGNDDLAPDMCSPVVADGLVFGCCGSLFCLDLGGGLKTAWESEDVHYGEYCTFLAGNGRVLITSQDGWLHLVETNAKEHRCVSRVKLFPDVPADDRGVWSHPALAGNRFYVRNRVAVYCYRLD
jgi:outer membrane protein assembly factor BamB